MYEVADVPKSFTPNLWIYESSPYQINWIQEDRINLVSYIVELRVAHISKSFSPNVWFMNPYYVWNKLVSNGIKPNVMPSQVLHIQIARINFTNSKLVYMEMIESRVVYVRCHTCPTFSIPVNSGPV